MSGIIYLTRNLINGKVYVGMHTKDNQNYLGSGKYLNRAIKKYGRENFTRTDLDIFLTIEEGQEKERRWIAALNCLAPNGYNLNGGGEGQFNPSPETRTKLGAWVRSSALRAKISARFKGRHLSEAHKAMLRTYRGMLGKHHGFETKAKMRAKAIGRGHSSETRAKLSARMIGKPSPMKGKHLSLETRAKISAAKTGKPNPKRRGFSWNRGKKCPQISAAQMGRIAWNKGKVTSAETKAKISAAHMGRLVSEETRAKLSAANKGEKNVWFGKHLSEEHRAKLSASVHVARAIMRAEV